jgi:hypothetical protein
VDGCEILHHLGWLKPYKYWDKLPMNWCRISQPSTVSWEDYRECKKRYGIYHDIMTLWYENVVVFVNV